MLFYLPLESYKERYTFQLSAARTGWMERKWSEIGLQYHRTDGGEQFVKTIGTGQVLDAFGRSRHAMRQIQGLLNLLSNYAITDDDVIYFEDFWHPGIEAFKYACHMAGKHPRMYAFLWAQSVDQYDFTHPMRHWMRPFEQAIGGILDGIFVANTMLKDLVCKARIATWEKVHVVGLPFCSEEVLERMDTKNPPERQNQVVFSSRWDTEKDPLFFLQVANLVIQRKPDAKFVICTSAPKLRSNDPRLLEFLKDWILYHPDNIILKENLSKEEYYKILQSSKIQFNCARQDWVSFTLLEATTAGCYPIYPHRRSFPETLQSDLRYMYVSDEITSAERKILEVLDRDDLWTSEAIEDRSWVYKRYDDTWARMTNLMGLTAVPVQMNPYEP